MQTHINYIISEVAKCIKGKDEKIKLALCAFLADGHILIEDRPGVGKTSLAKVFSRVLGLQYSRVQFTSDLLPSDILGINYFDTKLSAFSFKPGPIFSQFLLADEINRATPKTQSALLEAMEEHQVTIDTKTMPLPSPFFVMATKNPFEEVGTFELPSSQLDRFAISFSLGYPGKEAEREILKQSTPLSLDTLKPTTEAVIKALKEEVAKVHISDALLDYLQEVLSFTRDSGLYLSGLSTRGAIALSKLSKSWAFIQGRDYVIPSDISFLLPFVTSHRLRSKEGSKSSTEISNEILSHLHPDS
ncbi:MAG: AAA family ATPase [Arcobacter sp.]|nr:MAG: AAA family ATPase [Arcobacter sp.]